MKEMLANRPARVGSMWPQVTWVLLLALTPWAGTGEVLQPSLARPAVAASFTATLGKSLSSGKAETLGTGVSRLPADRRRPQDPHRWPVRAHPSMEQFHSVSTRGPPLPEGNLLVRGGVNESTSPLLRPCWGPVPRLFLPQVAGLGTPHDTSRSRLVLPFSPKSSP